MHASPQNKEELLVGLISGHQGALHRYILSLLPDRSLADDVLQETNLVLWRKAAEYDAERPFLPWAMSMAWHQVRAARRDQGRDRHVFDDDLVEMLSQDQASGADAVAQMDHALQECLEKLPRHQQELILARYQTGGAVQDLAVKHDKSATAISLMLMRIRKLLERCIEQKMAAS